MECNISNLLNPKHFLRKAGAKVPEIDLAQSCWALTQRQVPIEESLEYACFEGFEYFEAGLREERLAETRVLRKKFPLKLIAQGWAASTKQAIVFFQRALEFGAIALNLYLGHAFFTTSEAVDLVGDVQHQAHVYSIPLLFETHRGRLTQDLFRSTSVGTLAILRFTRRFCYQDFPDTALPPELQRANPFRIMRMLNGKLTRESQDLVPE